MALWTNYPVGPSGQTNLSDDDPDTIKRNLKCRALSSDFMRKLGTRFILEDNMLSMQTHCTTSRLLDLPYEVLLVIFSSFDHVAGQIAFALTCKKLAIIARDVDLCLSQTSRKYAGFLPVSVFDVPLFMHSLKPWMPAHLRLCNHCLTYRPADTSYYSSVKGCEISNFWIQKTGWEHANGVWHKQVHDICPACHVSCTFSDYIDCDGCRTLGRLGDVDWSRVTTHWRRRDVEEELRNGRFAT